MINILSKRKDLIDPTLIIEGVEKFIEAHIEDMSLHEAAKVYEKLNLDFNSSLSPEFKLFCQTYFISKIHNI